MGFDLEALIPIIVFLLIMIFGGMRRRKPSQRPAENNQSQAENMTEVDTSPESETVFPPFTENFEGFPSDETELTQETVESSEADIPMVAEQSEPVPVQEPAPESTPVEPPPVPVDSPTPLPTKPVPVTSLIDPSPETFRQGIILAEILGKPKTLRSRRR
jgi:hypothetical protein